MSTEGMPPTFPGSPPTPPPPRPEGRYAQLIGRPLMPGAREIAARVNAELRTALLHRGT